MLFYLICLAALIVGIFVLVLSELAYSDFLTLVGFAFVFGSIMAIIIGTLILFGGRRDQKAAIQRYHAFVKTVEVSRAKGDITEMERAAILREIVSWNAAIADRRYRNDGMWDWWHVDEYAELPFIE